MTLYLACWTRPNWGTLNYMVPFIVSAREQHGVTSAEDYLAKHAAFLDKKAKTGARFAVHDSAVEVTAWVGFNEWLVQCECGAGNATDPAWGLACCYGCGAIHRLVTFPDDPAAIERALAARVKPSDRHWLPTESVDDLLAQNADASPGVLVGVSNVLE